LSLLTSKLLTVIYS